MLTDADLQRMEDDVKYWQEHYDDAGDIETSFDDWILTLIDEVRDLNAQLTRALR